VSQAAFTNRAPSASLHGALVEETLLPRSPVRGLAAKVVRLDLLAYANPMLDIIGRVHTEQQNPAGRRTRWISAEPPTVVRHGNGAATAKQGRMGSLIVAAFVIRTSQNHEARTSTS
jgi:hypothetical protein